MKKYRIINRGYKMYVIFKFETNICVKQKCAWNVQMLMQNMKYSYFFVLSFFSIN